MADIIEPSGEKISDAEAKERISKTLSYSIKDGAGSSTMVGFGEFYLSAFAVLIAASAFQISFLAAFPILIASLLGLFAVKLTNIIDSRKKIVLVAFAFQVLVWPSIVLLSYLFRSVWLLIALATIYFTMKGIVAPAWASWIGDIVSDNKRGKFFGKRNRVAGAGTFFSVIIGGFILHSIESIDPAYGFFALFSLAFIGGLVSWYYTSKEFEPIVKVREPKEFGFKKFLLNIHKNNFGIFTLFISLMHFAVWLVAPIFIIYWLKVLEFSYLQYMVIIAAASISGFITITYWGASADYYGNKQILKASGIIISIVPAFWYLTRFFDPETTFSIGIILQLILGFAWAGFNLSTSNFIFDSINIENRVRAFAYFNALKGSAIFIGSMIGGIIASFNLSHPLLQKIFPTTFFLVLLISCLLRLIIHLIFMKRLQEVKIVEKQARFMHFAAVMPIQGIIFDSVVGMNRTIKRFKDHLLKIEKRLDYWQEDYKKKTKN